VTRPRVRRGLLTAVGVVMAAATAAGVVAVADASPPDPSPSTTAPSTSPTSPTAPTAPVTSARDRQARLAPGTGVPPNIVLITSDDQNDDDLDHMPLTRRLLVDEGVRFTDAISPHPLCCPARAEILTGEYAQNNGVRHNSGPLGGYAAFARPRRAAPGTDNLRDNLAAWLHRAGYATGFVGKTLNGYTPASPRMRGWDSWQPSTAGTYAYYGTRFEGDPDPHDDDYVADVVRDKTVDLIDRWAPRSQPFFVWASHVGPHQASTGGGFGPPVPAQRHADLFPDAVPPSLGRRSFDEADVSDKPRAVRTERSKSTEHLVDLHRQRLRSLQAVDEANAAVIEALARTGELDHTLVVYASDNGYLLGEHRLAGKNWPYDEDLQIPMVVRGPGVPAGRTSDATATPVDLAPTFLDYARTLPVVRRSGRTDGLSLRGALHGRPMPDDTTLIQAGSADAGPLRAGGWLWRGVRTPRYTWVRWWDGTEELYDRVRDRYELRNLVARDATLRDRRYRAVRAELRRRYAALADCRGPAACEGRRFGPAPTLR